MNARESVRCDVTYCCRVGSDGARWVSLWPTIHRSMDALRRWRRVWGQVRCQFRRDPLVHARQLHLQGQTLAAALLQGSVGLREQLVSITILSRSSLNYHSHMTAFTKLYMRFIHRVAVKGATFIFCITLQILRRISLRNFDWFLHAVIYKLLTRLTDV